MNCAAVIPCFNEAKTIGPLVAAMRQQLSLVVVVDDGSTDETATAAKDAGAVVIRHERNQGKGASLQTGLSQALQLGFDWAVTLDGDGQHSPADLPPFLRCAEETGAPLIIGDRMHQAAAMPWVRRRVNRWMSARLSRCAGRELPDTQSGFRLIHLQTWASLPLSARRFEVESEMLMAFLAANHRVEFVPIRVIAAARKSRIRPFADTVRWWKWWRAMKQNLNGLPKGFAVTEKFNHKDHKEDASLSQRETEVGTEHFGLRRHVAAFKAQTCLRTPKPSANLNPADGRAGAQPYHKMLSTSRGGQGTDTPYLD